MREIFSAAETNEKILYNYCLDLEMDIIGFYCIFYSYSNFINNRRTSSNNGNWKRSKNENIARDPKQVKISASIQLPVVSEKSYFEVRPRNPWFSDDFGV